MNRVSSDSIENIEMEGTGFGEEANGGVNNPQDPLDPCDKWPGLPQYWYKDDKYEAKPVSFWLTLVEKQSRFNPFIQWKPAYISYCLKKGGDATKYHINTLLATLGVVGALVASFIIAGLQTPPECANILQECHLKQSVIFAYGVLGGLGVLCCITTVVIVTIASLWIGLYDDHEMCFFLHRFYLASVMFPTTTMSVGAVSSMLMVGLRLYVVFDPLVAYISYGLAFIFAMGIGHVALRLVFYSIHMRDAANKVTPRPIDRVDRELVKAFELALAKHRAN